MRAGKVERLHAWLHERGQSLADFDSTAYSDSINDLPLLEAVNQPVAVDPDPRLAAIAMDRHWPVLRLQRGESRQAHRVMPPAGTNPNTHCP
jgi:phosphoserine phosphatase